MGYMRSTGIAAATSSHTQQLFNTHLSFYISNFLHLKLTANNQQLPQHSVTIPPRYTREVTAPATRGNGGTLTKSIIYSCTKYIIIIISSGINFCMLLAVSSLGDFLF